jgi:HlyD family secretion protein
LLALLTIGLWPRPVPVETARVGYGSLRATVDEEGRTRIRHVYTVSAPVPGNLRRIDFKPGAAVEAGVTVLATLDPIAPTPLDARTRSLAVARRDSAVAALDRARDARAFAASELRRFEQLDRQQVLSPHDLDAVRWRDSVAARELTAAEAALRQAEAELADFANCPTNSPNASPTRIVAPTGGRVLRVFEENARVVSAGTALLQIGDPSDLEVVIEVLSRDGAAIAPGTRVELDQWGGAQTLAARVRLVEPAAFTKVSALGVEEQRVNVIADLESPPDQRPSLGDRFRVETHIVLWETNRTLKVPAGALFRQGQDWAAFVVSDGRARLRTVRVGRTSGTEMQVLDGLGDQDVVIVHPGDRVRPNLRVQPITI